MRSGSPYPRRRFGGILRVNATRFAYTAVGAIAYQVVGSGPATVLVAKPTNFPIDLMWDEPAFVRFLEGLASFSRSIWFDPRGTGASDATEEIEGRLAEGVVTDVVAVLDEVGVERAVLLGLNPITAQLGFLLAATHPERIDRLVLLNPSARLRQGDDYPQGFPAEAIERRVERSRYESLHWLAAPSLRGNRRFDQWYERCMHLSATPEHRYWRLRSAGESDYRAILSAVRVPTLVLRRGGTEAQDAQTDYVASHITGAKTVVLPSEDALFFAGDPGPLLDAIAEFVAGGHAAVDTDRVLATVMFTDIVDSTDHVSRVRDRHWREVLSAHDHIVHAELERFRGHEVKSMGDGVLATFDGPGRALRCAAAIRDAVISLGLDIRVGLHTGEIELRGDDIGGIAVHIAQRIEATARPGEILVSRTVVDLVAGSGLEFTDRGTHTLKGIPGEWDLHTHDA
jgi:class 3 adenylate cyclase